MPIDTVLCDLGNVLAPFDFARAGHRFAVLTGRPFDEVFPRLRGEPYRAFESGQLDAETFFEQLTRELGVSLPFELCRDAWNDIFTIDEAMAGLMGELAGRYRTYLWSNVSPVHLAYLRARLPVLERFTGLHLSYELGAMKPDPAFYAAALARGKLSPERCIFIDDVPANLEGARAFGIPGVLHRSAAETRNALARLGVSGRAA